MKTLLNKLFFLSCLAPIVAFANDPVKLRPAHNLNANNPALHTDHAVLYLKPQATAKVLGLVDSPNDVVVLEKLGQWSRIMNPSNGKVGWIYSGKPSTAAELNFATES